MFLIKLKFYSILIASFLCLHPLISQQCSNPVIVTPPGNNLQSLISSNPVGTCFYFPNGNYSFGNTIPKDNMIFEGQSRSGVQINGNGFENAFHGSSHNVTFKNLTFFNFNHNGNAAGAPQEQSPIRGSENIWANAGDPLAEGWVIDNIESHSNIATGIFLGNNFIVTNSIFRNNGITGIAGDDIVGAYIYNNTIHDNGINSVTGVKSNGAGIKLTKAGSETNPIKVIENTVYRNTNTGIWGDIACHYWEIIGNTVYDHDYHGIFYEISDHAIIMSNDLMNNSPNYSALPNDWCRGGITIAESADIEVSFNTVANSHGGIVVQQTFRPAGECGPDIDFCEEEYYDNLEQMGEVITYVCSNITVSYNTIIGAVKTGVGNSQSGLGQLSEDSNIQFICNNYDNPTNMDFYWIDGELNSWTQWQTAGRDICPPPMVNGIPMCRRALQATIDGQDNDWGLETYELENVILGTVDSDSDLSAQFQISWDYFFLYIYATIEDDLLVGDSANPWEDDGIEIYIDGGNEKGTSYDDNDHQFIFKLTDPNTVYYHSNGTTNPEGVDYALISTPGVTYAEIKIDLVFFLDIFLSDGDNIGIDIHVNDDDDGGLRETKLSWNAPSDNAWNNPSLFGTFMCDPEFCYADCDLVSNGNFDVNLDGWMTWSCDAVINDGVCEIQNIQEVDNPWNAALAFPNIPLIQGSYYSFNIGISNGDSDRPVSIKLGKGSEPWTSVIYYTFIPSDNNFVLEFIFDMIDSTILDGRIEVQVGASQDKVYVDEVSLLRVYCNNGELCEEVIDVLDPIGQSIYHANSQIRSAANIPSGMDVSFLAGNNIELNQNFTVEPGAVFLAGIQLCDN